MSEPEVSPSPDEFRRLEESLKTLRKELEVTHHQQAYLQMQISALLDGNPRSLQLLDGKKSPLRQLLVKIAKRNANLYKMGIRISRFLKR